MRLVTLVVALAAIGFSTPATAGETQTFRYSGPAEAEAACHAQIGAACYPVSSLTACPRTACTEVQPGQRYMLSFDDDSGTPIGAYFEFIRVTDQGAETLDADRMCGEETLFTPEGATHLLVFPDGAVFGPTDCLITQGSVGIATQGEISLRPY